MTADTLHQFLIQPTNRSQCFGVETLVFELRLLGKMNGSTNEWWELYWLNEAEAADLISDWLAELQAKRLVKEVAGKWSGVLAPVVEGPKQRSLLE